MKNNFFNKSIGNINSRPFLNSEVTSQILYGEKFKILSKKKGWIKIKTKYENYTGFIKNQKFLRKILDDKSNYEIDYIVSENSDEKFFNLVKDESSSQNITNVA